MSTAAAIALVAGMATPAQAQDADEESELDVGEAPDATMPNASGPESETRIVVTGSRIARPDYNATSPIVTVDSELLEDSSAVNLEANLNKLPQFSPALTQFDTQGLQANANVTIGVSTVSLRQLGSNRNLVLVNGRRPTPVNGAGIVDINTIPSAAIQRVEIISGGASSTYGADAVGGVVNFILKDDFEGLSLDSQFSVNEEGDGAQFRVSGLLGASLDSGRGNVMMGMEYYHRDPVETLDRPWYRDLARDPLVGGTEFFLDQNFISFASNPDGRPSQAAVNAFFQSKGVPATFNGGPVNVPTTASFYLNGNNSLFLNTSTRVNGAYLPLFYGYDPASSGEIDGLGRKQLATGLIANNIENLLLSSPQERWSFFSTGHYDLSDNITVFGQANYASTETVSLSLNTVALGSLATQIPYDTNIYTGNPITGRPSSLGRTIGTTTYTNLDFLPQGTVSPAGVGTGRFGLNCPIVGGCTNQQVFPVPAELAALLNSRTGAAATQPFSVNLIPGDIARRTTVNHNQTFQVLLGFEGTIPGTDFTWEFFGSHGETTARTEVYGYLSIDRLREVLLSPNYGLNSTFVGNGTPLGANRNGATAACTSSLSPFIPNTSYTEDCGLAVAVDGQLQNRIKQDNIQANVQGGLFDLPYGQLRFAAGAEYRRNSIDFHADAASSDGSAFYESVNGGFPQASTSGSTAVREVYGEVLVPVLADLPFVEELNLELGYRYSDYESVGAVHTYKLNGEYAPVDWLRFRGGYQRASRAPNLGELFTARTQTQTAVSDGDPCSRGNLTNPAFFGNYSANPIGANSDLAPAPGDTVGNAAAAQVEALCRAQMGGGANTYYQAGRIYSTGGNDFFFAVSSGARALEEEDATTYTIGAVLSSPFETPWLDSLRMSVDYYNVVLSGGISLENINAVFRKCYTPVFNASYDNSIDPCQRIIRDSQTGEIRNVLVNYGNSGRVETAGVDVQLDWAVRFDDVGLGIPGRFSTNVQFTYLDKFATTADEVAVPLIDYAGTTGGGEVGTNAGSYRWKLFTRFNYSIGPATVGLQWRHLPSIDHVSAVTNANGTTITGAPAYDLFNLSADYRINDRASIRFGVDNLLNEAPPLLARDTAADPANGQLPGGRYDAGNYDVLGRRYFVGVTLDF
jgi:outer membrane receptor protein involved in Fe transport